MSGRSRVDPVASGACYVVTSVNEQSPASLDDFLIRPVVSVTVASARQLVTIHGSVRRDGDSVYLYEKDSDGVGKDVRTWQVTVHDGRFEAFQRPMY